MRVVIVGVGATGARAARQLMVMPDLEDLIVVEPDRTRREAVVTSLGSPARAWLGESVEAFRGAEVVLLTRGGNHKVDAIAALDQGAHVVSTSGDIDDVVGLMALDSDARRLKRHVLSGVGFSPGLTCVLAAFAAKGFERIDEIQVGKVGAGGPACAQQLLSSLSGRAVEWRSGNWSERAGGSGRELHWFPDPIRSVDCYAAALADPMLLAAAFPEAKNLTARVGVQKCDRALDRLPLSQWRRTAEKLGAVRVEIRGCRGFRDDRQVFGAVDRPSVAAGTVAALAVRWAAEGRLSRTGAAGLASLVEPGPFLAYLSERGVKVAVLESGNR